MSGADETLRTAPWSEADVCAALDRPAPATPRTFSGIFTDSRRIEAGGLFVALAGERFDAHSFLPQVAAAGATAAVVREGTRPVPGLDLIPVPDTLRALGHLARFRRRRVTGPVVAVTGTNGKTSTKEMLAAVLRTRWRTHATRANLNNLVGVPLTILEAPGGTEALVVEAGANLPGEIARYREIIEPDLTVVTNAVEGHLEGFGSLGGVLEEKLALADGVPVAVVGVDPPALAEGARRHARRVVTAALAHADVVPTRVSLDDRAHATIEVDGIRFRLAIRGLHQADNAMRVWAVVRELGLDPKAAAAALETVVLPGGRGELLELGSLTVLNDAYNANPQSFRASIATARAMRGRRRLVFVAGTMRELGPRSADLHREIAEELVALDPDLLAVVGDFVPALAPHAAALGDRLLTAPDAPALAPLLAERVLPGDVVVLKASRGVALERILPALAARAQSLA